MMIGMPHSSRLFPGLKLELLATDVAGRQAAWTEEWHVAPTPREDPADFISLVREQHRRNFDLWHEEDTARAPEVPDTLIASVKRRIDKLNQERNDLIEKLDDAMLELLRKRSVTTSVDTPWNSETPGSIIDRLSILSLKVFHMREQTQRRDAEKAHRDRCAERLRILEQQRADLTRALQVLLDDLAAGRKQLKLYRQFKMYNDPSLNPAIYGKRKA
jgi:hypothetical protein